MRTPGLFLCLFVALACGAAGDASDTPPDCCATADTVDTAQGLVVFDLQPSSGPVEGGTRVSLTGLHFAPTLWVSFGGAAAFVEVASDTQAFATAPRSPLGGPGTVDVRLGNSGAEQAYVLAEAYRYVDASPPVAWCRLQFPPEAQVGLDDPTLVVSGRVEVTGLTDQPGQAVGVRSQMGFGPPDKDPRVSGSWAWQDAPYVADADRVYPGDGRVDEVQTTLTFPGLGEWRYALRVSTDEGALWTVCDRDGTDADDPDPTALGEATVVESLAPRVTRARVVGPATASLEPGEQAPTLSARAYGAGLTDLPGASPDLQAEVGFGPRGVLPHGAGWSWTPGPYVEDLGPDAEPPSGADEYAARLTLSDAGAWWATWRFRGPGNGDWVIADLDGSENGVEPASLTVFRVGRFLEDCRVEGDASIAIPLGDDTPLLGASVLGVGVTDSVGPAFELLGQAGYGPAGSDPRDGEGWAWFGSAYQSDLDGPNPGDALYDLHVATLEPDAEGLFSFAFRFQLGSGGGWLYCDRTGSSDGFSPDDLPQLKVLPPTARVVDWCRLEGPLSLQVPAGDLSPQVHGLVLVEGETPGPGPAAEVLASLGTRAPDGVWTWNDATYVGDADGASPGDRTLDRYARALTLPVAGVYALAYRFSADQGLSWTTCDGDGSQNGFAEGALGKLISYEEVQPVLDDVRLMTAQTVQAVSGWHAPPLGAAVRVPGLSGAGGAIANLAVQIGVGPQASIPALDGGWTWTDASYDPDAAVPAGYDGYRSQPHLTDAGTFDVAVRASFDGVTWTYGDRDGSALGGYATAQAGHLLVAAPALGATISWCQCEAPATGWPAGAWSPDLPAQVFAAGLTGPSGWGAGIVGQIGLAPQAQAADEDAWSWFDAWYADDVGTNDRYAGQVQTPLAGAYVLAARFSRDGGTNWTRCDTNGPPFSVDAAALVEITP